MIYFIVLIILLVITLLVVGLELIKRSKLKTKQLLAVRAFQEKHGLSNRDLNVFKETMKEAKEQIILTEEAVDSRHDYDEAVYAAINASKEIFQYLMDDPKKILLYGDFLYRELPAFSNALVRRKAIQGSEIDHEGVLITKKSLDTIIVELSQVIISSYNRSMQEELEESLLDNDVVKKSGKNGLDEKER